MGNVRRYTDDQLVDAVAHARSWRGVLRELGLTATSAGSMRSVRARADRLGASYAHFTGQRRWTDAQLRSAVAASEAWVDAAHALGLSGGSATTTLKGHAVRLGLDTSHFTVETAIASPTHPRPEMANLARAGSLLAAAWFPLSGAEVSWPLEPSRYDLLVAEGKRVRRVQVKTTTVRAGSAWKVYLSTARRERTPYDPDEIDDFFIIDGDLTYYLVPVSVVGGLHVIHLAAYARYRVDRDL